ncbi:YMGG-like glycine zipper-containing protein [Rurimicrobium arvi]|uniref:YMGG-like Gly-zipper domain-containing protein n=1 Tax=Rurimicrobium arvi TaxID=2049916 RepID=A0ABP8MQS8_9BACT
MKRIIIIAGVAAIIGSCGNHEQEAQQMAQQRSLDSLKSAVAAQQAAMERQRALDSMTRVLEEREQQVAAAKASRHSTSVKNVYYTPSGTASSTSGNAAQQQRKGWSSTATGAVIGAGVGAVSGALIDDRKGRGAIIGGLAGAGVGAGTGAIIDNNKKKKESQR